jgi:anti-sigma factor RsiW
MNGRPEINDVELHAYLDGALDAAHCGAVEAALQRDPALSARLAAFRADKETLQKLYGPLADKPIPDHWRALAEGRPVRSRIGWRRAVAAAGLLLAAFAAFEYRAARQEPQTGEIVEAAIAARQGANGQTLPVSGDAAASHYDAMLSAAVAMPVKTPVLEKLGYRLTTIRLYPAAPGGSAAELLYRDKADRLFTLYLRRSNGDARFDQFERNGLRICIWQDDQLGMVMTGNVSTAAMQRLASLAYTGLTS